MDWISFSKGFGAGSVLLGFAVFTIQEYLKARVKHDYDCKLEDYRIENQDKKRQQEADILLFQDLLKALPSDGNIKFLRQHQASAPFNWDDDLSQLVDFCDKWGDIEHSFRDQAVDKKRQALLQAAWKYRSFLATNAFPDDNNLKVSWIQQGLKMTDRDKYESLIKEAHVLADDVVAAHENLLKTAREKSKC